jgi:hypothetical protein
MTPSATSKVFALLLIVLGVSPCTAPFATFDLSKIRHDTPDATRDQDFEVLKVKVSQEKNSIDLVRDESLRPSFDVVICLVVNPPHRTVSRPIPQDILRI